MNEEEGQIWFELYLISIFLVISVIAQVIIVKRILQDNWSNLRPIDIYQVNYFSGLAFVNTCGIHLMISKALDKPNSFCPSHILCYFLFITNKYDIIIVQLDRLVAVWKPYYYKEVIDFNLSIKVVLIEKCCTILITLISTFITPTFLYCPACGMCNFVQSTYLYTVSYPAIFDFILTVFVSVYVFCVINNITWARFKTYLLSFKLSKQVHPVVQETNQEMPRRILVAITERESGDDTAVNSFDDIITSVSTLFQEETEAQINDSSIEVEIQATQQNSEVDLREDCVRESTGIRNEAESRKSLLTKTFKMNLFTLAVLFINVPTSILNIMFENCDHRAGKCDIFFRSHLYISLCEVIITVVHPIVFLFFIKSSH